MTEALKELLSACRSLRKQIQAAEGTFISKTELTDEAERVASVWFSDLHPELETLELPPDVVDAYDGHFDQLLSLSGGRNRVSSYLKALDGITKTFRADVLLPVQKQPKGMARSTPLDDLLTTLGDPDETDYLQEARNCARDGYYRAAAVLGWSAAVDRIHRAVDLAGLGAFNAASVTMNQQTKGRFKKFTKVQNVTSISDLRSVFDDAVLWIVEGMGMIDVNQHNRLHSCLALRNQAAHPGDAPITEWNLLSFFSDLKEIVFENPNLVAHSPSLAAPP